MYTNYNANISTTTSKQNGLWLSHVSVNNPYSSSVVNIVFAITFKIYCYKNRHYRYKVVTQSVVGTF